MSERWESSSDFNGNLGLAERLANSIIALFPCPICIVSKGSDPDGHKLSCPSYACTHSNNPSRSGAGAVDELPPDSTHSDRPRSRFSDRLSGSSSSVRWRSRIRLWDLAGTLGTSPFCPLLTPHKAGSSIYGYGDFDGPGFQASAGEFGRYGGRASLPFGATLRGSPAGAGGGLCPL